MSEVVRNFLWTQKVTDIINRRSSLKAVCLQCFIDFGLASLLHVCEGSEERRHNHAGAQDVDPDAVRGLLGCNSIDIFLCTRICPKSRLKFILGPEIILVCG